MMRDSELVDRLHAPGCLGRLPRRALAVGVCAVLVSALAGAAPRITRPTPGQTVHSNSGDVQVVLRDLPVGALVQPVLDGVDVSAPVATSRLTLRNVVRGEHVLVVKIFEADGRAAGQTEPVHFTVFHASKLMRRPPR